MNKKYSQLNRAISILLRNTISRYDTISDDTTGCDVTQVSTYIIYITARIDSD